MRRAPLQLDLQIEAREPAVHQMLRSQGVAVDKAGSARVLVGGTLGRPELRAAPNARAG